MEDELNVAHFLIPCSNNCWLLNVREIRFRFASSESLNWIQCQVDQIEGEILLKETKRLLYS